MIGRKRKIDFRHFQKVHGPEGEGETIHLIEETNSPKIKI